ncbi:uracil permease [Oceanotoga teriensis]|uniref:Uracil permease n=1 Tax=Oceanotoga teriensis TaxID=515440 RepID=A0AA45C5Y9_9BACT|nr:solute carrier family 23 protein [Oceanotoga teriensis]PWJ90077.1 uracil permease [Oceanotoga teriensis]
MAEFTKILRGNEKDLTKRTILKRCILSLQHFVAMFGATILVPLLTGFDPLVTLFAAGCGTLIFHFVTGLKVPVFLGSSFAFIAPIMAVKEQYGDLSYASGAIMIAGLVYLLFSLIVKLMGYDILKKLFPTTVTGTMIIIIGLSLAPTAMNMSSSNWVISISTLITVVIFSTFFKGFLSMIPVLMGVLIGYLISVITGNVDFTAVTTSSWVSIPSFSLPKFSLDAISVTVPLVLATFMEHIGDITTNGAVVGKNFFKDPGLHKTLLGDGIATAFAGFVGAPANTTYSENTGVLAITKNYDPSIIRGAAFLAIIFSFLSKFGAILSTIPEAVIGGIGLMLFGMISSTGIRTIVNDNVDFSNSKNICIVSIMLTTGLSGIAIKLGNVEFKGVALAAIVGIILNLIIPDLNKKAKKDKI